MHQKEMTHFREVLARLRNAPFAIDAQGEVQFDLEAVLTGQQCSQSNIASDDEALDSLKNADWEMDFSGIFIDEDEDGQATRSLDPVPNP
ncbi:MAG: hypothetical protein PHU71_01425 [Candidatus Gracilibacteria bacterium]|nr:hypothetical protein [Candidatus Gracilibacteria bacterium]